MIPESHPLQQLFVDLVGRHYAEEIGLRDPQIVNYVAHLLAEFCDAEQLFKIRNAAGRPLDRCRRDAGRVESHVWPAPSFDRERQVRKHIGDYTLFLYRHVSREHQPLPPAPRPDGKFRRLDQGRQGKLLHRLQVRTFRIRESGALFANLSQHFEQCVYGLNLVKNDLQEMQHPIVSVPLSY